MDSDKKRKRDNELFLKAFEKPTQIYRYMRWRYKYSPIYLNRNLSYLRGCVSRGKSLRHVNAKFDFLEFFERMKAAHEDKMDPNQSDVLAFKIYGCFDEKIDGILSATVDIYSIGKYNSANREKLLCSKIVEINPSVMKSNLVQVTIPKEHLEVFERKSSQLLLEVSYNGNQNDEYSRSKKRKKVSYEAHINVFDEQGRCILIEGEYELLLRSNAFETKKHRYNDSHWQDIPISFGAFFKGSPRLKFFLCWGNHDQMNANQFTTASQHLPLNMYANKNGIKSSTSSIHSSASSSTSGISSDMTEDVDLSAAIQKTNQITQQTEMDNISSHLVYRFLYGNNLSQQTEACDDFNCPWCYLNCFCLEALMMHLRLCHDRFKFSVTKNQMENGVLIDVRINEQYQCSLSSKVKRVRRSSKGLRRRVPKTKVLVARRRSDRYKINSIDPAFYADTDSESEAHEPLMFDGHGRGYYRTTNNLPFTHRMDFDEDSEGEHDPGWLRKHTKILINDFSDVNEGEKELMVMWNWHVMKKNFIGMSQMPLACEMFVDAHGNEIWAKQLYRNFTLHLCNLFDNGMLSSTHISNITRRLQNKRE